MLLAAALAAVPARAGQYISLIDAIADQAQPFGSIADVVVSSDGQHVYAASGLNQVLLFDRDAVTGSLTYVANYVDGVDVASGLDDPNTLVMTSDGAYLYVASDDDRSVSIFARDALAGTLTLAGVQFMPDTSFDSPRDVAMSPDEAHLYVVLAGTQQNRNVIAVYERDPGTGLLALVEISDAAPANSGTSMSDGRSLAIAPDGGHVYVTALDCGGGSDCINGFARDVVTGRLTLVDRQIEGVAGVFGIEGAQGLVVSDDDAFVYVAASTDQAVAVFSRNPGTGVLLLQEVERNGVAGVIGIATPRRVALSPDGAHLHVVGGADLAVFDRDAGTGLLTFAQAEFFGGQPGLGSMQDIDVGTGTNVYIASETTGSVDVFTRDVGTGVLTFLESDSRVLLGPVEGLRGARSFAVTADGETVYVSGGFDDAIVRFDRDPVTGLLTFAEAIYGSTNGFVDFDGPAGLALSIDEEFLYVAASTSDAIVVLDRDPVTGGLSYVQSLVDGFGQVDGIGGINGLNGANDVLVDPTDTHVYVTGPSDGAVVSFVRDPVTGELTYIGVNGTSAGSRVLLSPDGLFLYSVGANHVSVFARDPGTGVLTSIQPISDGNQVPDDTIDGAVDLALTADGSQLYVAASLSGVSVFDRDAGTGLLTFVGLFAAGDSEDVVDNVRNIVLRDDEAVLFAYTDDGIAILGRNPSDGTLTFGELDPALTTGGSDVITVDGTHHYVTFGNAVATLEVGGGLPCRPGGAAKLTLKRVNLDPDPTNDDVSTKGVYLLDDDTFAGLDPSTQGFHFTIEGIGGDVRADVTLPGGVYGGSGTSGWLLSGSGKRWAYIDRTGSPVDGIVRVKIVNATKNGVNQAKIVIKGRSGSYPVVAGDLPVALRIDLPPTTCNRTQFGLEACVLNASQTTVKCKQ